MDVDVPQSALADIAAELHRRRANPLVDVLQLRAATREALLARVNRA